MKLDQFQHALKISSVAQYMEYLIHSREISRIKGERFLIGLQGIVCRLEVLIAIYFRRQGKLSELQEYVLDVSELQGYVFDGHLG
jgi:hypothetical protein